MANTPAITVDANEDLTKLRRNIKRTLGDEGKKLLKEWHKETAEMVLEDVVVPKGPTGRLEASVRATGGVNYGSVRAGKKSVPYAPSIHWGRPKGGATYPAWPNYTPQPFLYRAIDSRAADVVERARELAEKYAAMGAGDN